jgi:phage gpG-like protein
MKIRITIPPTLTTDLRARLARAADTSAMAMSGAEELKTWATRAFDDASLRAAPWAPRKGGGSWPLLKRHGLLWRSFRVKPAGAGKAEAVTDRPYAAAHQFGTPPKVIRPKNKKALFWPGAAHPVREVHHPGVPARPYFPFNAQGTLMPAAAEQLMATTRRRLAAILGG